MSYEGDLVATYNDVHKRLLGSPPLVKKTPPLVPPIPPDKNSLEALLLRIQALEEQVRSLEIRKSDRLKNFPHYSQPKYLSVDDIFQLVVKKERFQPALIRGTQRYNSLCRVRHIIFYLAATQTNKSMFQIARYFDRDHTTIMHGRNKIAELRMKDATLDNQLHEYETEIARLTEARNKP